MKNETHVIGHATHIASHHSYYRHVHKFNVNQFQREMFLENQMFFLSLIWNSSDLKYDWVCHKMLSTNKQKLLIGMESGQKKYAIAIH